MEFSLPFEFTISFALTYFTILATDFHVAFLGFVEIVHPNIAHNDRQCYLETRVPILPNLSPLVAKGVVIAVTSCDASDAKVGIMVTRDFH